MNMTKLQSYIGAVIVVAAIVAFVVIFVINMPSNAQVNQQAQTIPSIPSDLFSNSNPLVSKLNSLNVPSGVPVVVDPNTIGRSNVFQSY